MKPDVHSHAGYDVTGDLGGIYTDCGAIAKFNWAVMLEHVTCEKCLMALANKGIEAMARLTDVIRSKT